MLSASRFGLSALGLVLFACSGASTENPEPETPPVETPDETPPPATGSFELRVVNTKVPVLQGESVEVEVEILRKGDFKGAIELSAVGLPEGTTVFYPEIDEGARKVTLELSADEDAPHSLPTEVELRGEATESGKKLSAKSPMTVTVCGHPGALDTSFREGRVIVPVGAGEDYAYAMALQADGKILVAGRSAENYGDFSVIRLKRDGELDTSFGDGGKVITEIGSAHETAYAVAVQEDGKIVVAGTTATSSSNNDFAVVRYLPNGELDSSFGDGGKVVTGLSEDTDTAYALLIQEDGKIVVGGTSNQGSSQTGNDFALVRYEEDGSLDESFGDGGQVLTPIASNSGGDHIYALASQTIDGEERIVAVGGEGDFVLARYREDGSLDASFGEQGKIQGVLGSTIGAARAVHVNAQNQILVAGHKHHDFALVRFTEDGQLDTDFGEGEPVITPVSEGNWDEAQGLAIESDGKIVVGGWTYEGQSSSGNFALVRYSKDGALDTSFGETGIVITEVAGKAKNDLGTAVILQPDERVPAVRVLFAGSASDQNHDFAVTRFWR